MLPAANRDFWRALDALIAQCEIVIDRPTGSRHPKYSHVSPADYGYLKETSSMDGGGIDLWTGSLPGLPLVGMIVTVDRFKRDSEIKLLLGLTAEEIETVLAFHNESDFMKGLLIRSARGDTSTNLSVGIFSPSSVSSVVSATASVDAAGASFARSAWLLCAERATEKNRSTGTVSSGLPSNQTHRGRCRAAAHVLPCRTWHGPESAPAPR